VPDRADGAGGLPPDKEKNAVRRRKNRKDGSVFSWFDYIADSLEKNLNRTVKKQGGFFHE